MVVSPPYPTSTPTTPPLHPKPHPTSPTTHRVVFFTPQRPKPHPVNHLDSLGALLAPPARTPLKPHPASRNDSLGALLVTHPRQTPPSESLRLAGCPSCPTTSHTPSNHTQRVVMTRWVAFSSPTHIKHHPASPNDSLGALLAPPPRTPLKPHPASRNDSLGGLLVTHPRQTTPDESF